MDENEVHTGTGKDVFWQKILVHVLVCDVVVTCLLAGWLTEFGASIWWNLLLFRAVE